METASAIKNYLVGDNHEGYLFDNLSEHKLVMIVGKWGSGKTYFWKKSLEPKLKEAKKDDEPIITISLYGKRSLDEIKTELFMKAYKYNKNEDIVEKVYSLFISVFDRIETQFAVSFFKLKFRINKEDVERKNTEKKIKEAGKKLNNHAVICFDDFERKSSEIDLNDLFGFINNLKEEFKCTVIIIVNDEAFHEEEAKIFARVKEKSVDKFLRYLPSVEQLFEDIKEIEIGNKEDDRLESFLNKAKNLLKELDFQNARIYKQIINNINELNERGLFAFADASLNVNILKFLIFNTIFFNKHNKCLCLDNFNKYSNKKVFFSEADIMDYLNINIINELFPKHIAYRIRNSQLSGARNNFEKDLLSLIEYINNPNQNGTVTINVSFKFENIEQFKAHLRSLEKDEKYVANIDNLYNNVILLFDTLDFVINKRIFKWIDNEEKFDLSKKICKFIETGLSVDI